MEKEIDFRKFGVQDFLSLGYLYLLLLGIITEVVYYKLIGVNILFYSGLMDVILSPINFMTRRLIVVPTFLVFLILLLVFDRFKRKQQARKQNEPNPPAEKPGKSPSYHPQDYFIKISAMMVFFMFIGGGIGAGMKQSYRIQSGDFECQDVIEFMDGETLQVRLVGQNNDFLFYIRPGEKDVTIVPLRGNVKRISRSQDNQEQTKPERQLDKQFHNAETHPQGSSSE